MDRDTLTGIVLIALILFFWTWQISRQRPPATDRPQTTEVTDSASASPTSDRRGQPAVDSGDVESPRVASRDTTSAGETGRSIVVQSDLYEATFSTRGATLTSFRLNNYDTAVQGEPVQLVHNQEDGALAVQLRTDQHRPIRTKDLVFSTTAENDTLIVANQPLTLTFEAFLADGSRLQETYQFFPERYKVDLSVGCSDSSTCRDLDGYDLIWTGGLPFTERSAAQEAGAAGVYLRSQGEIQSITLTDQEHDELTTAHMTEWTAVKNKYFTAALIPRSSSEGAVLTGDRRGSSDSQEIWEDYQTRLHVGSTHGQTSVKLYLGPMEYYRLRRFRRGLFDMEEFGYSFLAWCTHPLVKYAIIPTFYFLENFLPSYGLIIIVFAILIKFLLYPLTRRSHESMAKMKEIQPRVQEIKKKYEDNPQKQQKAMMTLYKDVGVNPLGGCLPMLLQFPFIITLWRFFPSAVELRQHGFLWASDLSAPDIIVDLPFAIPFYGDHVAGFTLLMGLSMMGMMSVRSTGSADTGGPAALMKYIFPLFIVMIFNGFASGVSLYYLVYNLVTAAQQVYIKDQIHSGGEESAPSSSVQSGTELPQV